MHQSNIKPKSVLPLCPMCRIQFDSYYRIPRVIPKCGHTFCQKCINMNLISKSNRKIFICPNCQSQTIIRKGTAQDIPTNIQILQITKSIKRKQYQQSSPINNKNHNQFHTNISNYSLINTNSFDYDSNKTQQINCTEHVNKPMDLICSTCNYQRVCSTCVLLHKNHENHKFVQFIPASKIELSQVNQIFTIIQDSVKQTILPTSNYNILKKTQQKIISLTIQSIQKHFKQNYYKVIQKKQQQLIKQCKQIRIQLPLHNKIEQIAKIYDLLKIQYSQIMQYNQQKQSISLQIIQQFISKCKHLHHQIQLFSEYSQKQSNKIIKEICNTIEQTQFIKFNEIANNISLKSLLVNMSVNPINTLKKQKQTSMIVKSPSNGKKASDSRSVNDIGKNKKSSQNDINDFDINQNDQIKSIGNIKNHVIQNTKQKQKASSSISIIKNNINIKTNKTNSNSNISMPPKNNIKKQYQNSYNNNNNINNSQQNNKIKQTIQIINIIPPLQLNVIPQSKSVKIAKTTTSNTERINSQKQYNQNQNYQPINVNANPNIINNATQVQQQKSRSKYSILGDKKSPYKKSLNKNEHIVKSQHQVTQQQSSLHNTSIINNFTQQNITLNQVLRIKQVRPSKQIPLNLKSKFNSIINQLTRQSTSTTLELISMQINDNLIVYLCQYLRVKKIKFQMIKLVKNQITDQGLINDDVTQVLNLTSNQLTNKSLQLIIQLGQTNKMLKTIYLGNNKINSLSIKQKKMQLQNVALQIIM